MVLLQRQLPVIILITKMNQATKICRKYRNRSVPGNFKDTIRSKVHHTGEHQRNQKEIERRENYMFKSPLSLLLLSNHRRRMHQRQRRPSVEKKEATPKKTTTRKKTDRISRCIMANEWRSIGRILKSLINIKYFWYNHRSSHVGR